MGVEIAEHGERKIKMKPNDSEIKNGRKSLTIQNNVIWYLWWKKNMVLLHRRVFHTLDKMVEYTTVFPAFFSLKNTIWYGGDCQCFCKKKEEYNQSVAGSNIQVLFIEKNVLRPQQWKRKQQYAKQMAAKTI